MWNNEEVGKKMGEDGIRGGVVGGSYEIRRTIKRDDQKNVQTKLRKDTEDSIGVRLHVSDELDSG
jgi:hypothetical protein